MSVLYTITSYPPVIGGAQLHLHELARRIARTRAVGTAYQWDTHRTDWLMGTTLRGPEAASAPEIRDGVPALRIALTPVQRERLALWVRLYWIMQDAALDRIAGAFLPHLESAAHLLLGQPPALVHHSRIGREGLSLATLRYARAHGVPFVLTPNHHDHWRGWRYRHFLDIYRRADRVIAQTAIERDMLIALGVHPERTAVLGIGAILADQADPARVRARLGVSDEVPIILCLGQKFAYKRWDALLAAMPIVWRRHPRAIALFIGPRTARSRAAFARIDDARIVEWDAVDLQTKTDALAACQVLCVPSERESFGGVYLEAFALGKPVIAGSAPAVAAIVTDGVNGWRVQARDTRVMADAIASAIDTVVSDPALAESYGRMGYAVYQRYHWDKLSAALLAIYDGLS